MRLSPWGSVVLRFFDADTRSTGGRRGTRREWLRTSGLASLGWVGGTAAAGRIGDQQPGFGNARSVILLFANGGQSQFETWDPKPQAPLEVRGEFAPISTAIAGTSVCQHMPRIAQIADRLTIVRSMAHEDRDHGSAAYLALTGQYHQRLSSNPAPTVNDLPTYGAVLRRVRRQPQFVYDAVHLNGPAQVPILPAPGQNAGLLGRDYEPLVLGDVNQQTIAVPGLVRQAGLTQTRMRNRVALKATLESSARALAEHPNVLDAHANYRQAFEMLSSPKYRNAFDLSQEAAGTRARYGRNRTGQACLLARRLVEAGVPLVTIMATHSNRGQDDEPSQTDQYGWDTHNDIFTALKRHLLPRFDLSFSALIEDLEQRGLLETTLVVCMGEFGRAPRVAKEPNFPGNAPGRKHWPDVYSIALAGAGVARGAVVGASDRLGASPLSERYGPWDVAATMYSALGIDPQGHYHDVLDRPLPICRGKVISALYG